MITAESTVRFWTNPDPIGSYMHYGMKHFSCHNNNDTLALVIMDKRGE